MSACGYSNMKNCTRKSCKQANPQPTINFRARQEQGSTKLQSWCRSCENARKQEQRQDPIYRETELNKNKQRDRTPEATLKRKEKKLIARYGITLEQQKQMLSNQNGKCGICPNLLNEDNLHTDHNHKTGKVRGLLCVPCNHAIGLLQDSPEIALSAASYIAMDGV